MDIQKAWLVSLEQRNLKGQTLRSWEKQQVCIRQSVPGCSVFSSVPALLPKLARGVPVTSCELSTFCPQLRLGYQFLGSGKWLSCLQSVLLRCFMGRSTLPIFQPTERIPSAAPAVPVLSENHWFAAWPVSRSSLRVSSLGLHFTATAPLKQTVA